MRVTRLHAGKAVRVKVNEENATQLLVMAAEKGFDWVHYTSRDYVTLSVALSKDGKSIRRIA